MKLLHVSKGGQISIPASIRRRWATDSLLVEDLGDRVILRPVPTDPVEAAAGALAPAPMTTNEARARIREEEAEAEERKYRR